MSRAALLETAEGLPYPNSGRAELDRLERVLDLVNAPLRREDRVVGVIRISELYMRLVLACMGVIYSQVCSPCLLK